MRTSRLGMSLFRALGVGLQQSRPGRGQVGDFMVQTCHSLRAARRRCALGTWACGACARGCTVGVGDAVRMPLPRHRENRRGRLGASGGEGNRCGSSVVSVVGPPAPLPVWGAFCKCCANEHAGPVKMLKRRANLPGLILCIGTLAACGGFANDREAANAQLRSERLIVDTERATIWDLFGNSDDPSVTVEVNRYLWRASLEVLDFMPVEAADPFTGIIAFGYATPPGGRQAYRATVYVTDPALEARSLRVALQGRGENAVSRETARQVEDAILTRARQLRVADSRL